MWWRTKFADENTIPQQLDHIQSEFNEVIEEYNAMISHACNLDAIEQYRALRRMKQEALDLIQSIYTLLHILGMTEREHEKMKWEMEVKNHERGYYHSDKV